MIEYVMAFKPFTFDIWGKNLSLLRSYYTGWKGLIHTSPMQFIWSQSIDFWQSYTFMGFSDYGNLGPWPVVSPIVSLRYSTEAGKYI